MIRKFIRFVFKGIFWICAVVGLLLIGITIYAVKSEQTPTISPVPEKAVLTIELEGSYAEHSEDNLLQELLMGRSKSLFELTQGLHHAAHDDRVKAVLIYMTLPQLGLAQIQELRGAIGAFRSTGKKVYFYSDSLGYGEFGSIPYYLASACDQIWIQKMGSVGLTGIHIESPYLNTFFEKVLYIKPEFGQRKEYKSAPEMYTNSEPTEANQQAMQAIAQSIMDQMIEGISKGRSMAAADVEKLMNEGPYLGQEALKAGLIDGVIYRPEIRSKIKEELGYTFELYEMDDYSAHLAQERLKVKGDKIALIFDSGMVSRDGFILDGSEDVINNDKTNMHFMSAINNEDVKAIVYRVNSLGGDPVASQTISHIIEYAKLQKKPVIVSMSNAATSGGYWISCMASKIVAQPGTLTGSIGVYGGKFSLQRLWDKLGVNWSGVSVGENGNMWSFNEDFSPQGWVRLNQYLDFIYQSFIQLVANGRSMTVEDVEKVAKGRVWTGEQAQALGLVDQLGGLADAIQLARKEANLPDKTPVILIPTPKTLVEKVMALVSGEDTLRYDGFLQTFASPLVLLLKQLSALSMLLSPAYSMEAEVLTHQTL